MSELMSSGWDFGSARDWVASPGLPPWLYQRMVAPTHNYCKTTVPQRSWLPEEPTEPWEKIKAGTTETFVMCDSLFFYFFKRITHVTSMWTLQTSAETLVCRRVDEQSHRTHDRGGELWETRSIRTPGAPWFHTTIKQSEPDPEQGNLFHPCGLCVVPWWTHPLLFSSDSTCHRPRHRDVCALSCRGL